MLSSSHTVKLIMEETFDDWYDLVQEHLDEMGHSKTLSEEDRDWFFDIWENHPLTAYDAARSYLDETTDQ